MIFKHIKIRRRLGNIIPRPYLFNHTDKMPVDSAADALFVYNFRAGNYFPPAVIRSQIFEQ
jgi:hypothetical protein